MRPGRAADPSPPSSAAVMEEKGYTSTHPLGHTGPVTGSLYLYLLLIYIYIYIGMLLFNSTRIISTDVQTTSNSYSKNNHGPNLIICISLSLLR